MLDHDLAHGVVVDVSDQQMITHDTSTLGWSVVGSLRRCLI